MVSASGFAKTWEYIELFRQGLITTVSLSALTVLFGFVLALLLAVMRLSNLSLARVLHIDRESPLQKGALGAVLRFNPVSFLATAYVEVFRATPMLVQLFIVYYGLLGDVSLPSVKLFGFLRFDRFVPGVVALALNSGAYLSEIIRSGIQSIDAGQTEAARSLGMSPVQTMRFIILPQAIKNILPAIANEFVTIIKESSITYTIAVQDIMSAVWTVKGAKFIVMEPLLVATALYFCLTFPTSKIIAYFERRMSAGDRRNGETKQKKHRAKGGAKA